MNDRSRVRQTASILLLVFVLAGCGGTRPLSLTLYGTSNMNSVGEGEGANAAVVRIYQLTNATNFTDVTPDAFWRDDKAALGDELISSQQFLLYPDQTQTLTLEPAENAQYIGVAADLRRPDQGQWRQIYAVEELRGREVQIEVGATQVRIGVQ